jgi:hypothetical protein
LLLTCVWILYESVRRLWFSEGVEVLVTGWSFFVVIFSIVAPPGPAFSICSRFFPFLSQSDRST